MGMVQLEEKDHRGHRATQNINDSRTNWNHMNNNLRIGYSYDFTLTKLARVNSGSHEIMIGYDFNQKKKGIYHPRYFQSYEKVYYINYCYYQFASWSMWKYI